MTRSRGRQPSTMTILIAYDGSGSTGGEGNRHYHNKTQQILAQYPDAQVLYWDTVKHIISRAEMADINATCRGGGGTNSAKIAEYIKDVNYHGELIIITDGEVPTNAIDTCASLLGPAWKFTQVTAYLIQTGGTVNMSVTCPFTRVSPHQIYIVDRTGQPVGEGPTVSVSAADMEVIDRVTAIDSVAAYLDVADMLDRLVIARTMGTTGDPSLRDSLLAMKKRITAAQARALGDSDAVRALHDALDAGRTAEATEAARAITEEYYGGDDPKSWSGRISRLVSMCEGALRGAFDLSSVDAAIKGDRVRRAAAVAPVPAPAPATVASEATPPFECPITLSAETDVALLVTDGEPILAGLDLATTNDILDCPLNIFHYPDVVSRLRERLDHPISLAAYKEAIDAGAPIMSSPLTRAPLLAGAICLGGTEAHSRATNWTLAQLTTGGKLVGNPDLWFAVVWLIVYHLERGDAEYLSRIEPELAVAMRWRMANHTTSISLSGVPELPTTRVRLDAAIWYVFASVTFHMYPRSSASVLRAHLPHLDSLQTLLEVLLPSFKLPNAERIHEYILHTRVALHMLRWVKQSPAEQKRLMNIIHGLFQATVRCGDDFIPIDGPPTEEQQAAVRAALPAWYRHLSTDTLFNLSVRVDPSKSAGDVVVVYGGAQYTVPDPEHQWDYRDPAPAYKRVPICAATCRPFYTVEPATWREAAEAHYHMDSRRMISMNELYGNYVVKYGAFPTEEELLNYVYQRKVVNGKYLTLPLPIEAFVKAAIADYAYLSIEPAEFARRFVESRPIERRRIMEQS